jgi:hypothetical protein
MERPEMMKFFPRLIGSLVLITAAVPVFAAAPTAPAAAPAPAPTSAPAPASAPATAAAPVGLKLDDFINDLASTLNLADGDKKKIEELYVADGPALQEALNNDALSPLQKAEKVSDIRDARNAKVIELLPDEGKQEAFFKVEAKYRVALTELAAEGGLVASPAPEKMPTPAAPAPASPAAK